MANLGSFGDETELEVDTFDWFGTELRVNPLAGEVAYLDFVEKFGSLEENDPRAVTASKDFMREIVHEDDFDVFWRIARERRQGIERLFGVAMKIIEAITGRPTERSSDSPPGPSATAENSTAASYSRVRQELEQEGRADLALVYLQAEEAKVAS